MQWKLISLAFYVPAISKQKHANKSSFSSLQLSCTIHQQQLATPC